MIGIGIFFYGQLKLTTELNFSEDGKTGDMEKLIQFHLLAFHCSLQFSITNHENLLTHRLISVLEKCASLRFFTA